MLKCSRPGCPFKKHSDPQNNGGTHCCKGCKIKDKHGPACQGLRFKLGAIITTTTTTTIATTKATTLAITTKAPTTLPVVVSYLSYASGIFTIANTLTPIPLKIRTSFSNFASSSSSSFLYSFSNGNSNRYKYIFFVAPNNNAGIQTTILNTCTYINPVAPETVGGFIVPTSAIWITNLLTYSPTRFDQLPSQSVTTTTTLALTTKAPTTVAATTKAPTTSAATTKAPTTVAATTKAPTTVAATTKAPTTSAATTSAATTSAATTKAPTTVAATTKAPTTSAATTNAPTTVVPTTSGNTTIRPFKPFYIFAAYSTDGKTLTPSNLISISPFIEVGEANRGIVSPQTAVFLTPFPLILNPLLFVTFPITGTNVPTNSVFLVIQSTVPLTPSQLSSSYFIANYTDSIKFINKASTYRYSPPSLKKGNYFTFMGTDKNYNYFSNSYFANGQ